jgi:LysR family hydrogen peroxide-inducible transcriptional activator
MVTNDIIKKLKTGDLDVGLLATPLLETQLSEQPLFYEEFYAYVSADNKIPAKKLLLPKEIDLNQLWLLEEGHCLRNQVFNLCELKKQDKKSDGLHYEAGSIETLVNLVDKSQGITIIPHLATLLLKQNQKDNLHQFADPKPVREISLVTINNFPRKKLLENLKSSILETIPFSMQHPVKKKITGIGRI